MIPKPILFVLFFQALCLPELCAAEETQNKKPNVILILTDDQGYGDLGCHGNDVIRTPNLDKLHSDSLRLTDFHAWPCCSPTRAALLTGNNAVRTGSWSTTGGRFIPRKEFVMVSDVFGGSGYNTAMFGKWHQGDNYPYRSQDRGFQEVVCHEGGGISQVPDYWGNDYFDDVYLHNGKRKRYKGYCTDVFFDEAMSFIEKNARPTGSGQENGPFFCYISTNTPHSPSIVAERYRKLYEDDPRVPNVSFYGMITNIDENVGRLRRKLNELGIEDNTILIFMTDNGTAGGVGRNGTGHNSGMKGRKGSVHEGGHRVPCFVRWPSKGMMGGKDIGEMTSCIDLLPTLIELCDLKAPEGARFDGISIASLLTGEVTELPERSIPVTYAYGTPGKWSGVILNKKWRLLGGKQLYDISIDPGQTTDVAAKHPEVVARLRADYEKWWAEMEGLTLARSRIPVGSDAMDRVKLDCQTWQVGIPPWRQGDVVQGKRHNGVWLLDVMRDGDYEITLRRWPEETGYPITAVPKLDECEFLKDCAWVSSRLRVRGVDAGVTRIKIGDVDVKQPIKANAHSSVFRVKLKAGEADLQTWFIDKEGKELCGAHFCLYRTVVADTDQWCEVAYRPA